MRVTPRYDHSPIIQIDGDPLDQLEPVTRQRRRLAATLSQFRADDWEAPSRCDGWRAQDVVAHLAGVDQFWTASVSLGRAGQPSRYLAEFDPVATPALMVDQVRDDSPHEILERFIASSEAFLSILHDLEPHEWSKVAEAPPGHLPIRLLASHALWDAWIHERDIELPRGNVPTVCADEVTSSLRYVAALSGAFLLQLNPRTTGSWALEVHDPSDSFVVTLDGTVVVRHQTTTSPEALRGDAISILEALSFRVPLPDTAPSSWRTLVGGLATMFETITT